MRQSVLDSAQQAVSEGGIEALTIRGIAKNVGYSPAAIYEYFHSKEDIVHCLYFEGSGGLSQAMQDCAITIPEGTDALTVLRALGRVFREVALANKEMYRLVFGVLKQPEESEDMPVGGPHTAFRVLVEAVQRGIADGDLMDVNPVEIAVSAWAAAHGFISLEVTDHFQVLPSPDGKVGMDDAMRQTLYESSLNAILRGWATEQGMARYHSQS